MGCPTEVEIGDNLVFTVNTHRFDTGAATDADAAPTYRVYEDETAAPILTGTMALLDDLNTTGFYSESIACTSGNGFENGKTYTIYITCAVNSVTGTISYSFKAYDARKSDLRQIGGVAQSATDLKDFADTGYDPSTHLAQADVARLGGAAQSATDLKDFADTGYDPVAHKVQGVVLADGVTTVPAVTLANGAHGGAAASLNLTGGVTLGATTIANPAGVGLDISGTTYGVDIEGTAGKGIRSSGTSVALELQSSGSAALQAAGSTFGIQATAAAGPGINAIGTTYGIWSVGTAGPGIAGTSGGGNGAGLLLQGNGTAAGLDAQAGATGHGIRALGGATSGDGINTQGQTLGDGITAVGAGAGQYDINADIQGNVSGSVNSVTNPVTPTVIPDVAGTAAALHGVTNAAIAALNNLSSAQAQAAATAALNAYDGPTNAEMVARTRLAAEYALAATALSTAQWTNGRAANLDNLDVAVSSVGGGTAPTTAQIVTAIKADTQWRQILAAAKGRAVWDNTAKTLTYYHTDGTTPLFTLTLSATGRTTA